jgi:mRNA interferase RelE/StbE
MIGVIVTTQTPIFKKVYKKLHANEKLMVDDAIRAIIKNPKVGQEKKGDLAGIFVYKFKIQRHKKLLAYEWSKSKRILLTLGTHENFYRDLKNRR